MAIYRNIQMAFWTDANVIDDYTPDDKLFYLYILTNPHTNLCGCYEISIAQMSTEIGYDRKKIDKLIDRATNIHGTILYDRSTKEMLILNWYKYNWTESEKFRKPLMKEIETVKNAEFKAYLIGLFNGNDTVSIPYGYRIDTTVTVTDTVTVSDTDTDNTTVNSKVDSKESNTNGYTEPVYYPNDDKLDQAFRDYVDMRKKIKSPMTDRAITLAQNKLKELAAIPFSDMMDNDLAIKILNQSTMNNWKGLFPLKDDTQSRTQKMAQEVDSWTRQSSGNL